MRFAKRMEPLKGLLTMEMNMRLARMKAEGRDVINLGIGDPDFTPPGHLLQVMKEAVGNPDYHHYPSSYRPEPLRKAIADWYRRRFAVDLDPATEVLPLLGSTDGLFMIHFCLLEPGDVGLVPDPSYPSYEACVNMTGARTERVPLLPENAFLPDLDSIPSEAIRAAKLIWVNYPNNPTGATATPDFYRRLISWAKENDVAVVSDNAYSEVYFDEHRPVSFLEFPGARDVGVEIHSLSKSYNCCGWRSGMLVGNKDLVAAVGRIKVHSDRGMFYPLQLTSVQALNSPADLMAGRNRIYQERRDLLVQGLGPMGFKVYSPKATFYLWAGVPNGVSSLDFCYQALEKANVWMIPGFLYGPHGEGYVRIAFTQPVERLAEAVRRLEKFLS